MRTLRAILHEILGLFVDDGSLAVALLIWCAVIGLALATLPQIAAMAGSALLLGCAAILLFNIFRSAQERAEAATARLPPLLRLVSREIWLIATLLFVVGLVLAFGILAGEVLKGDTSSFDSHVFALFRPDGDLADPIGPAWAEEMGRDITALGSTFVVSLVAISAISYLLLIRKFGDALLLTAAELGGNLVSFGLKIGIDRVRPELPHAARVFTASFPSGHAMLSAVTFLIIGALLTRFEADRRLKIFYAVLAVFLTVIIGVSRIYLGLHYASDVIAGWMIGAAWAILCWRVALRLQRKGQLEAPARNCNPDILPGTNYEDSPSHNIDIHLYGLTLVAQRSSLIRPAPGKS